MREAAAALKQENSTSKKWAVLSRVESDGAVLTRRKEDETQHIRTRTIFDTWQVFCLVLEQAVHAVKEHGHCLPTDRIRGLKQRLARGLRRTPRDIVGGHPLDRSVELRIV